MCWKQWHRSHNFLQRRSVLSLLSLENGSSRHDKRFRRLCHWKRLASYRANLVPRSDFQTLSASAGGDELHLAILFTICLSNLATMFHLSHWRDARWLSQESKSVEAMSHENNWRWFEIPRIVQRQWIANFSWKSLIENLSKPHYIDLDFQRFLARMENGTNAFNSAMRVSQVTSTFFSRYDFEELFANRSAYERVIALDITFHHPL